MIELPLIWGNITLAGIILALALALVAGAIQLGIYLIRFILAFDDENAPKIEMKNPLKDLKVWDWLFQPYYQIKEEGAYWYVKGFTKYLSRDENYWWTDCHKNYARCTTKQEAQQRADKYFKDKIGYVGCFTSLCVLALVDTFIFMLTISFIPTLTIGGLVVVIFSIRSLSKRFYKGMHEKQEQLNDHKERINNAEERITTLEEK